FNSATATGRGLFLGGSKNGNPTFMTQLQYSNTGFWWKGIAGSNTYTSAPTAAAGTGYLNGFYQWTGAGGGCAREPSGVWQGGVGGGARTIDPGALCSTTPTVSLTTVGSGVKQSTGSGGATTCVSNSPVSGKMTVTAHLANGHGFVPGQTYALSGFTPTGYNATYTAVAGTAGTTLVGVTATGGGTCPAAVTAEGSAFSGVSGSVTLQAVSTTGPFTATPGGTGITALAAQNFCGVIGEYGADSSTPGFQFAAFTDQNGNSLPGSPALITWPNQGVTNFTGYTVAGAQSPSSPALTVTAMNAYSVTAATYSSGTGYVTFTTSAASGLIVGSEFTVSGVTPSGYNRSYIAVAGTSG